MTTEVLFDTPTGPRLLPEAVGEKLGYRRVVETPTELIQSADPNDDAAAQPVPTDAASELIQFTDPNDGLFQATTKRK